MDFRVVLSADIGISSTTINGKRIAGDVSSIKKCGQIANLPDKIAFLNSQYILVKD
jgi:hypothetical protein